MWTFQEAEAFLKNTAPPGKSMYGLERISHLLDLLGHPENDFEKITIVGTNGKGSVLAFLDSLLRAHGLKVVCHVKPHLESVRERIRINGVDSSEDEFSEFLWEVYKAVENGWNRQDSPTYFEIIFAASLCAARKANADVAILEAGLGGRLDAVNAIDADLVVLTSIGFDHMELLGDTLDKIAAEKIAVIRPGGRLVYGQNHPIVEKTINEYIKRNNILSWKAENCLTQDEIFNKSTYIYTYKTLNGKIINGLEPSLGASYQFRNISVALVALEVFLTEVKPPGKSWSLNDELIKEGIFLARLPGRWEVLSVPQKKCQIILDGAHNPEALALVFEEFRKKFQSQGVIVFGAKKDKAVKEIMSELVRSARNIIFVPVPDVDFHPPESLACMGREASRVQDLDSQVDIIFYESILDGINKGLDLVSEKSGMLVTGSLYLIGAARSLLRKHELLS